MAIDGNKAIVRRLLEECLAGGEPGPERSNADQDACCPGQMT